jgi:hypothetical protein
MKVLAIGSIIKSLSPEQRQLMMTPSRHRDRPSEYPLLEKAEVAPFGRWPSIRSLK